MPGIAESSVCDLANYDMTSGGGAEPMRGVSALRPTTVIERVWCDESSSAVWREPMGGENRERAFRLPGRSAEGFAERLWMPLCHATKYLRVGISDGVWEIRKS